MHLRPREHWIKVLHPADRRRVLAEDERTGETGEPFSMEYRQFAKDGRVVWVRDEAVLVRDEEGNPSYWLGVQHDITERKRAEEEIKEVNRRLEELAVLKDDFTAMVAHELDTPLAVIRGYADMLATGKLGASDRDRALAKIQAETDVMAALITDARTAAAIEREDFVVKPRRVPIGALMKAAGAFAETLRGDHPLVIENLADGQEMWADPYRIGQVLRNLLSNAAKYSPDGAPIELRAVPGKTPGRVRIEVSDRGVGVHPDDVNRIFEKFGRGRDSSGRKVAGVGLGLYLSRRILQAHGSDLTLDPAPGDGSVFGFELEAAR
jgi:signal transduction histidine kinase